MTDDFSELAKLAADLGKVPAEAAKNVHKAIEFTSISLRDDWREGATIAHGYAKSYAPAISYDMKTTDYAIESDIGPVLGKTPGASAGFLEEAGGGVDGPAHHAGRNALEANEEDFYRGLEIAITQAVVDEVEGG